MSATCRSARRAARGSVSVEPVLVRRERELRVVAVLDRGEVLAVGVAHRTFAPIHTAAASSAPIPAVQMNTPSVTGP